MIRQKKLNLANLRKRSIPQRSSNSALVNRVTSSIGEVGQIDLKTAVFALSFLFYHRTKLLVLVTTVPYEVNSIFLLPKTVICFILYCTILWWSQF